MKNPGNPNIGAAGFVLLGLSALAFLMTQITHRVSWKPRGSRYDVTALFDDVGDLNVGSRVSIAGVDIGRVSHIDFDAAVHKAVVSMELDREFSQIPDDCSASINTQGLLGGKFIRIASGDSPVYLKNDGQIRTTHSVVSIETVLKQLITENKNANDDGRRQKDKSN
jgi:phospholipid/cholesterol/gamma-HCH transport system substrate-binding protein